MRGGAIYAQRPKGKRTGSHGRLCAAGLWNVRCRETFEHSTACRFKRLIRHSKPC